VLKTPMPGLHASGDLAIAKIQGHKCFQKAFTVELIYVVSRFEQHKFLLLYTK